MVAAVVLAGGKSSRMGCDKSQLKLSGVSLIEHSKNTLSEAGIKNIFISGKNGIQDQHINLGPLGGILASLEYLTNFNYVLFTTVDMPLLNKQVFQNILNNQNSKIVYIENHFFPLLICNTAFNRQVISKQLNIGHLSIKNMLKQVGSLSLKNKFSNKLFLNANTREDWLMILKINGQTA